MGLNLLITGGTGFIGSRLALRCVEAGHHVRVLAQRNNPVEQEVAAMLKENGVRFVDASVTEPSDLRHAFEGCDVVFHLAAAQHEANVSVEYFRSINVDGTRNVFDAALSQGVGRIVHGSTIGVYGWVPGETIHENDALTPGNIYGKTKLEAELVVRDFGDRIPWVIVRISETYGPGDRRLLKLFKGASKGYAVQIGAGKNLHHLVFVDDLIDGLLLAATRPGIEGETFVLAGSEPVTTRQMLDAVADSLDRKIATLRVPLAPMMLIATGLEMALGPIGIQPPLHRRRMDFFRKSFAFSIDKAREKLGYAPQIDLEAGAAATAAWYRSQNLI